jgi:hypothetical protein
MEGLFARFMASWAEGLTFSLPVMPSLVFLCTLFSEHFWRFAMHESALRFLRGMISRNGGLWIGPQKNVILIWQTSHADHDIF